MSTGEASGQARIAAAERPTAWLRRHAAALPRGLALFGLAIAGLMLFLLNIVAAILIAVGLVPVHLAAVAASRTLANLCRRLAHDWGGVRVPAPYRPGPPSPQRRPDGWYVYEGKLFKFPLLPRMLLRMRWVGEDPATPRDGAWMLLNPAVGGVLALLPAALVGFGVLGLLSPWMWPGIVIPPVLAVPLGVAGVVTGIVAGPTFLRLHGRWSSLLLRPSAGSCGDSALLAWIGRRSLAVCRGAALFGLSVAGLAMFVLHLLAYVVAWGWGQPQMMDASRQLTNTYRRLAQRWAGVEIAEPYLPMPTPPEPGPDGMYRYGRSLHSDPRAVVRAQRIGWVLKDLATWRDLAWMLTAPVVGALLVVPVALVGYGFFGLIWQPLWWPLWGLPLGLLGGVWIDPWQAWEPVVALAPALDALPAAVSPAIGAVVAVGGLLITPLLLHLHASWSRLLLAPTERARLAQRVAHLAHTRTNAVDAEAAELRRIERDLHDGAQARLVSMGMRLGAIEQLMDSDPDAAKALLSQVRQGSAEALTELRELVRGIHPPVLSERGLADAVRALALESLLEVEVAVDMPGRLEPPVESAAYFGVSEALTNATKHAEAGRVWIHVRHRDGSLRITITDDGRGGADPSHGSGLRGIERRLATFDGVLSVASPQGGPTTVTMAVPCALSSPKPSGALCD